MCCTVSHGESDMAAISLPVISKFDAIVFGPLTTLPISAKKAPAWSELMTVPDMGGLFQHLLNTFRRLQILIFRKC